MITAEMLHVPAKRNVLPCVLTNGSCQLLAARVALRQFHLPVNDSRRPSRMRRPARSRAHVFISRPSVAMLLVPFDMLPMLLCAPSVPQFFLPPGRGSEPRERRWQRRAENSDSTFWRYCARSCTGVASNRPAMPAPSARVTFHNVVSVRDVTECCFSAAVRGGSAGRRRSQDKRRSSNGYLLVTTRHDVVRLFDYPPGRRRERWGATREDRCYFHRSSPPPLR